MAVSYQVDNVGSLGRRRHGCDWPLVSITVKTGASFPFSQVDKIGSHVMANASREQMSYTIDVLKTHTPAALELLCDSVLNPALEAAEVRSVWWATRRPGSGLELLCDSILNPVLEGAEVRILWWEGAAHLGEGLILKMHAHTCCTGAAVRQRGDKECVVGCTPGNG